MFKASAAAIFSGPAMKDLLVHFLLFSLAASSARVDKAATLSKWLCVCNSATSVSLRYALCDVLVSDPSSLHIMMIMWRKVDFCKKLLHILCSAFSSRKAFPAEEVPKQRRAAEEVPKQPGVEAEVPKQPGAEVLLCRKQQVLHELAAAASTE